MLYQSPRNRCQPPAHPSSLLATAPRLPPPVPQEEQSPRTRVMETHLPQLPPLTDLTPPEILAGLHRHGGSCSEEEHGARGCSSGGMERGALDERAARPCQVSATLGRRCWLQRATWLRAPPGRQRRRWSRQRQPPRQTCRFGVCWGCGAPPAPSPPLLARGAGPQRGQCPGRLLGDRSAGAAPLLQAEAGTGWETLPRGPGRGCPAELQPGLHQQPPPEALDATARPTGLHGAGGSAHPPPGPGSLSRRH